MPTSALVLTLDEAPDLQQHVLTELQRDERISVGIAHGSYLPIVLETQSSEDGVAAIEALWKKPGIAFIDLVQIDFSDEEG
ncbi:MAG: hypothetical protein U0165_16280 [Polyangiaceae bacterium]